MAELLYNVFKNTKNEKKNLTILASDLTWAYKKEHNLMNWSAWKNICLYKYERIAERRKLSEK